MNKGSFSNKYKIVNNYVIIYLKKRNGEIFETYIDLEDLDKLKKLNLSWHVREMYNTKNKYAICTIYLGKVDGKFKNTTIYLHQFVLGIKDRSMGVVDHINPKETLDNRKNNLRLTKQIYNTKNRKSKNSNNSSGYRNVSWLDGYKKWCVQLQIDGKNTLLGKFDEADEAGQFAKKMRQKYYGQYAGK